MPTAHDAWPHVDVIVAVRDEAQMIAGKLLELESIDYPPDRLRFLIVDGGSSDGTLAAIEAHATRHPRVVVIPTTLACKPAQLNEALARARAPWVLVTDADARVPPATLKMLLSEAASDGQIGVVGTTVIPHEPHPLDAWHWRLSNWARCVERRTRGTTGLAVATCYLFRRDLCRRFADDALADDVHVVCEAARRGARTAVVEHAVTELRVAATSLGWFWHKVRRTMAYQREIFRYASAIPRMTSPMRAALLWRSLALTAGPPAGLAGGLLMLWLMGLSAAAGAVFACALAGVLSTRRFAMLHTLQGATVPLWILFVTTTALLLYPFVKPSAAYSRPALRAGGSEAWS